MPKSLYEDEKDAIALYVKKLIEDEEERRGKRLLKYTAIAALFSAALVTAFGSMVIKNAEFAAVNSLKGESVTRLMTERLAKALDDSNTAIDAATSAKRAATTAQEAASRSNALLDSISQNIEAAKQILAALSASDKFVTDISTNPILQKAVADRALATLSPIRILAMIQVKNGRLVSTSPGVSFDQASGVVSFHNPRSLTFVPIVSDSKEAPYITGMHWTKAILPPDRFIVRLKAMDTGDRTFPRTILLQS